MKCANTFFFSAQLLAKVPGHRPRYFNRYNDILDIRQHVDLISVQNPGWLMKKYRVKNYPNLSNINCELSGSRMGFPFKKKPSFGLKNTLTVETCCWIFQDKFMKRYVHNCSHPLNLTAYAEAWLRNFQLRFLRSFPSVQVAFVWNQAPEDVNIQALNLRCIDSQPKKGRLAGIFLGISTAGVIYIYIYLLILCVMCLSLYIYIHNTVCIYIYDV